ncbi:type VI secretion protein, partial [Burkholderia cepacia]
SHSPSPNPSGAPTTAAEDSATNAASAGPAVGAPAPNTSGCVARPSNVISLSTGEIVDGDTGEVHSTSAPREPVTGERPTGRAGLGDLLG